MLEEHGPVNFPHTCMCCCGMHASTNIHTKKQTDRIPVMSRTKTSTIKSIQGKTTQWSGAVPSGPSVDFACAGGGGKPQTASLKPRLTGRWAEFELPSCGRHYVQLPHGPCCPLHMSLNIKVRSLQVRPRSHPGSSQKATLFRPQTSPAVPCLDTLCLEQPISRRWYLMS